MASQAAVETPLDRGDTPVNPNSLKAVLGEGEQPFSFKPQNWQLTSAWGSRSPLANAEPQVLHSTSISPCYTWT